MHITKPVTTHGGIALDKTIIASPHANVEHDSRSRSVEEFGLFLRHIVVDDTTGKSACADISKYPDLGLAITAMINHSEEPLIGILQDLVHIKIIPTHKLQSTFGDETICETIEFSELVLAHCSPEETCVLLDTLKSLAKIPVKLAPLTQVPQTRGLTLDDSIAATCDVSSVPPSEEEHSIYPIALYQNLYDQVVARLQPIADISPIALHGNPIELRKTIIPALAAKAHNQQLAQLLLSAFHRSTAFASLSLSIQESLHIMLKSGTPLPLTVVHDLERSTGFSQAFMMLSETQVREIMTETSKAARKGMAAEVLALWAVMHVALQHNGKSDTFGLVSSDDSDSLRGLAMGSGIEIQDVDLDVGTDPTTAGGPVPTPLEPMDEVAQAKHMGRVLQSLIQSEKNKIYHLSHDARVSIQAMAEHGTVFSNQVAHELSEHWYVLIGSVPIHQVHVLIEAIQHNADRIPGIHRLAQCAHETSIRASEVKSHVDAVVHRINLQALHRAQSIYHNTVSHILLEQRIAAGRFFHTSRTSIETLYNTMASGLTPASIHCAHTLLAYCPPLLRIEIVRDFIQTTSLFFTNMYTLVLTRVQHMDQFEQAMQKIQVFYRGMYNMVSADYSAIYLHVNMTRDTLVDAGFVVLLVFIVITYMLYLVFGLIAFTFTTYNPQPAIATSTISLEQAMERAKKKLRAHQRKIKYVTTVLTICLSIYLPITRLSIEILAGSSTAKIIHQRYGHDRDFQIAAGILILTFSFPLPFILSRLVHKYKPNGIGLNKSKTYNLDGEWVELDDNVYAQKIAKDPAQLQCPYRSLYAGLEKGWCYYKVVQLVSKVFLILPLILIPNEATRGYTTLLIYIVIVLFTSYSAPFADPLNDAMEISGKVTALITCAGGVALAHTSVSSTPMGITIVGAIVNFANLINSMLMIGIILFGMPSTREWIKNGLGTLTFSDTVRYLEDLPSRKILPHWDVERELKHRVWHHFWKTLLLELKDEVAIQRLAYTENEMLQTHQDKKSLEGAAEQRRHWAGQADECISAMRLITRSTLEGNDVYYKPMTVSQSKPETGKIVPIPNEMVNVSYFGQLTVIPYPFHCRIDYDDQALGSYTIVDEHEFTSFFFINFTPEIVWKRMLRQQLRALSRAGILLDLPVYERVQQIEILTTKQQDDGSVMNRMQLIDYTCRYTRGIICVYGNGKDSETTSGFHISIKYCNGEGQVVCPDTGDILQHISQQKCEVDGSIAHDLLGLLPTMEQSEPLRHLLSQSEAITAIAQHLPAIQTKQPSPRLNRVTTQAFADRVLSPGFRHVIYNNPKITRDALETYLAVEETNPRLQKVGVTHRAALDELYTRMNYIHSDPAKAYWYLFWDDVYAQNGQMKLLAPYRTALDPHEPTSIAYEVMTQESLKKWLKKRKLWGKQLSLWSLIRCRKSLFHHSMINTLYEQMERRQKMETVTIVATKEEPKMMHTG